MNILLQQNNDGLGVLHGNILNGVIQSKPLLPEW